MAFYLYGRNRKTGEAVRRLRIDASTEEAARAEAAQRGIDVTSVVPAPSSGPDMDARAAIDGEDASRPIFMTARVLTAVALLAMAVASFMHARDARIYYEGIGIAAIAGGLMLLAQRMRQGRAAWFAAVALRRAGGVRVAMVILVSAVAGYLLVAHLPPRIRNDVNALMPASLRAGTRDDARAEAVRKLAQRLGDATVGGDYAYVVDNTYAGVVELLGGRLKAIETTKTAMEQVRDSGVLLQNYTALTPGNFISNANAVFVVVPVELRFAAPAHEIHAVSRSYLLGISTDAGRTWKFADGSDLDEQAARDVLPALPPDLTLPEKEKPQIVHDN